MELFLKPEPEKRTWVQVIFCGEVIPGSKSEASGRVGQRKSKRQSKVVLQGHSSGQWGFESIQTSEKVSNAPQNCPSTDRRLGHYLPSPHFLLDELVTPVLIIPHISEDSEAESRNIHDTYLRSDVTIGESLSSHRNFCHSHIWNQRWAYSGDTEHQELLLQIRIATFTGERLHAYLGLASR